MSTLSVFSYIRNFFNESKRGVWGKQEIILTLDTLYRKYHKETAEKLQEEISKSILGNREPYGGK